MKKLALLLGIIVGFTAGLTAQTSPDCATPMVVQVNGPCLTNQNISDVAFETGAPNNNICATTEDVTREGWYTFQATSTSATVTWTSGRAPAVQVFDGTCGALGATIGCANNILGTSLPQTESVTVSPLVVGNYYLIRIVNTAGNNIGGANAGTLCVTGPITNDEPCDAIPIVLTPACNYNSFTNVGSTVTGGVPVPGCGLGAFNDVWFSVQVPASGNVIFDQNTGGMTDGDMAVYTGACGSLTLLACDDLSSANGAMARIVIAGQTPGAILYIRVWGHGGTTGTFGLCAFDAAQPVSTNCTGAIPVCNSTTFAGGATGFGVQELNAANRGCISSNESQTTWFGFSPQATGTIGLLITPTAGIVDYDFAIWGPYPTGTCPVNTPPIRCSWAAETGTTGLITGAGDNSEGSGGDRYVNSIVITGAEIGMIYYLMVDNWSNNASPFTLNWNLSPPGMLDCTPPLPVVLQTFDGIALNKINQINWTTEVEINNNYFLIEKSSDAVNYTELGRVDGHDNTNILQNYNMIDYAPYSTTYYRLKQVDHNGDFTHYGPISINNNQVSELAIHNIYPNPADHSFFIDISSKELLSADLMVFDSYGRAFYSKVMEVNGATTVEIATEEWPSGVYVVKINNDAKGLNYTRRVVIQ